MVRRRHDKGEDILGAIDVGTNAVRLELAEVLPDGSLETLHTERDPVRPGEGLFATGTIKKDVADRLISVLRRYGALCKRYGARVRVIATSAVREAKNREDVVRRARKEAGLVVEVVSGREEARLICLGVLQGRPPAQRSVCIDIGGGSTEVIFARGETPTNLWSVDQGAVRMTELFHVRDEVSKKQLRLMRDYAREGMAEAISKPPRATATAVGSSGTIGAVVTFAREEGVGHATTKQISRAVEELADMDAQRRRKRFEPRRADIVVAGAVILEAALKHLKVESITAVDRGLREGILLDLLRRRRPGGQDSDHSLEEASLAIGERFGFGERHALHVAKMSLTLFDDLAHLHQLPAVARPYLHVSALLHDIGHAVNHQRHHKHSQYLILNSDIPGLSDREKLIVAAIARYHRRSKPEAGHEGMEGFTATEVRIIRKCATLLRVADSLDRSHVQPVAKLSAQVKGRWAVLRVKSKATMDLELWDVAHEEKLFREVFGKALQVHVAR